MTGTAPRSVDWSGVTGAVHRVRHHYRYTYSAPVTNIRQRLIMVPPDRHTDQHLLDHSLEVRGTRGSLTIDWVLDDFGNRVCRVEVERVEQAVDFEVEFQVSRAAVPSPREPVATERVQAWLEPTPLTAPDERLREAANQIRAAAQTTRERIERTLEWAASALTYETGITGTQTPAAMALHLGRGVCQDYAHVMLAVLRLLDIPCRYVSGHLLGDGAPHAWVEALVLEDEKDDAVAPADATILALDPTHGRPAGLDYVTVAVGRDFADVSMTSGVFSGAALGRLHWSKHAEVVRLDGQRAA